MKVKIKPLTKRAKDRVQQHGEIMRFVRRGATGVLVESLNNTWRGEKWLGWFSAEEAQIEEIESKKTH